MLSVFTITYIFFLEDRVVGSGGRGAGGGVHGPANDYLRGNRNTFWFPQKYLYNNLTQYCVKVEIEALKNKHRFKIYMRKSLHDIYILK